MPRTRASGEIDRGERLADEGLAIALEHNAIAIPIAKSAQAEIFLLAGRLEDAEAAIAESVLTRLPGLLHFAAAANAEILKGRIAAIRGDHAGAVEIADQVVEWLRPLGVRPYIPAALLLKGSSLAELGKLDEAERALLEGSAEAEQLGFDPILWQIEMALSRVASATGDAARAAELRSRGQRDDRSDRRKHRRRRTPIELPRSPGSPRRVRIADVRLTGGSRAHGPHRSRHRVQAAGAHRVRRFSRRRDDRVRAARGSRRHVRRPPVEGPNRRRAPRAPHVREGG